MFFGGFDGVFKKQPQTKRVRAVQSMLKLQMAEKHVKIVKQTVFV